MTLLKKALAHSELGDPKGVTAACDEIIERFGDSDAPQIQVQVAKALFNKGNALGQLGDTVAAIVAYGDVVERFGDCDEPSIQMVVARALVNKGYWKGQLGKAEAAIAAYDEVVRRVRDSDVRDIQIEVAKALVNKGATQGSLGEAEAEIAAYDEVDERFGDSDVPARLRNSRLRSPGRWSTKELLDGGSVKLRRRLRSATRHSSALETAMHGSSKSLSPWQWPIRARYKSRSAARKRLCIHLTN